MHVAMGVDVGTIHTAFVHLGVLMHEGTRASDTWAQAHVKGKMTTLV